MQFPKELTVIRTNLEPMDFYEILGVLEEHKDALSIQPAIEYEGSLIVKFYYAGLTYQLIQEYGLVVELKRL